MKGKVAEAVSRDAIEMDLEQGGKLILAPATGYLSGDLRKPAELYIAMPEGETSVCLMHSEVNVLIRLMRDNPERFGW